MKTKTIKIDNKERLFMLKHVNKLIAEFAKKPATLKTQVLCYGLRDKLRAK